MSNKDNWDDESGDEEELDPILKEGGLMRFNLDAVNTLEIEAPIEYNSAEIAENEEGPNEEEDHPEEEYPPEEDYEDEDYEDELDDYDKKLGRYVSCR
jgi:hypothetical protein